MTYRTMLSTLILALMVFSTACGFRKPSAASPGSNVMGRIFTSGFESQEEYTISDGETVEWSIGSEDTTIFFDTAVKHAGACSMRFDVSGVVYKTIDTMPDYSSEMSDIFCRFYFRYDTAQSAAVAIWGLSDGDGTTNKVPLVRLQSDGKLRISIRDENVDPDVETNLGASTTATVPGVWYRVEVHWKASTGPSSNDGEIHLRIDGVDEVSATGQDFEDTMDRFIVQRGGGASGSFWFDDVALNDTAGTIQNSWPGEGFIELLKPIADEAQGNWVASSGSVFFSLLDDLPGPIDGTDYIVSTSATANNEARFQFTPVPLEYGDAVIVTAMQFGWSVGAPAQSDTLKYQLRDAANNTFDVVDFAVPSASGAGATSARYPIGAARYKTWDGNNLDLTAAYLRNLRVAVVESNTRTRELRVGSLWVTIEFAEPPLFAAMVPFSNGLMRIAGNEF